MADSILTNYTQSGPVVANGTVGTTTSAIVIRSPAEQRAVLNVYSTDQANATFLPVSTAPGSSATMAANINMSGNAINNLKTPVATSDAATKAYVDSTTVSLAGDTMTGSLQMNNNAVTGLPVPQNATDAVTKAYVDTKFMVAAEPNNVTGIMQMNNNIITGLPAPQNSSDAANKNYVDTTRVAKSGDTMTGTLSMVGNRITDLPTIPLAAGDAVNKTYVDTMVAIRVATLSTAAGYLPLSGTGIGTMSGPVNMGNQCIAGVLDPVNATDAATKSYVDTQDAAKLSRSGGTMTGALNMGAQAISNAASLALNGTSSSDALTLSKASGGAAYTLALPSAAPAANTYLQYTGSSYAWSAVSGGSGSGGGGVVAAQYLFANDNAGQSINGNNACPYKLSFPNVVERSGITNSTSPVNTFTLPAGATYILRCELIHVTNAAVYQWADVTAGTNSWLGSAGCRGDTLNINGSAIAYITTTISTNVAVFVRQVNGTNTTTIGADTNWLRYSWVSIEQVSNTNAITAFTGATSVANGAIGYIPAPQAGDQAKFLCGNGSWATAGGIGATKLGLGMTGETYHDVTSQRIPTTAPQPSPTYINNRTYPIMVIVGFTPTDTANVIEMFMTTDGPNNSPWMVVARISGANIGQQTMCSALILPNQRYWPGVWGGTYDYWFELY